MRFIAHILLFLASVHLQAATGLSTAILTNFNRMQFTIDPNGSPTNVIQVWFRSGQVGNSTTGMVITNISGIPGSSLWTNSAKVVQLINTADADYSYTYVTNLFNRGVDVLLNKPIALSVGENVMDTHAHSGFLVDGATATAADSTIRLASGYFAGQRLEIVSYANGNQFTVPAGISLSDSAGLQILNGDFIGGTNQVLTMSFDGWNWKETGRYFQGGAPPAFINPTENYMPLRSGSAFVDSPLRSYFGESVELFATNANTPYFNVISSNTNVLVGEYHISLADSDGTADLLYLGAVKSSGWGAGTPSLRDADFFINLLHDNAIASRMIISGSDGSVRLFDVAGSGVSFRVDGTSGYTGAGTKALYDDGTYKTVTAGTTINSTDGYSPYRVNATTFGDSPWYRITADSMGFNVTNRMFSIWGTQNLFLGLNSGNPLTSGVGENTSLGFESMTGITTGSANVGVGWRALKAVTTGTQNVGVGLNAGKALTTGVNNTALGNSALSTATGAFQNTAIGADALQLATGDDNTGIGNNAANRNSSGAQNTAVGSNALLNNETGGFNSVFGYNAQRGILSSNLTGVVAIGAFTLYTNVGNNVVAVGYQALNSNFTGTNNVAVGYNAGLTNVTGSGNTFLGHNANPGANNVSNSIAIGANVVVTNSNEIVIGNSSNTKVVFPITSFGGDGTKALTDDGTYKTFASTGGTVGTVINTQSNNVSGMPLLTVGATGTNAAAILSSDKVYYDPAWWGAVGDGVTDDSAAFNAMFTYLQSSNLLSAKVFLRPVTYFVNSSVTLPIGSALKILSIDGYGATIKTTNTIPIFYRMITNQTQYSSYVDFRVAVRGVHFLGNSQVGQEGIKMAATFGSVIEDCNFETLNIGLDLFGAIQTTIRNCRGTANTSDDFVLQSGNGVWTGGNLSNANCHCSVIQNCEVYGGANARSHYRILAANNVRLINCVSEGNSPTNSVYFDDQGSTTCKQFTIQEFHNECSPSAGIFKLSTIGSVAISSVYNNGSCSLMDTTGSGSSSAFHISDISYWSGFTLPTIYDLKSGPLYLFENISFVDLLATNRWSDPLPSNLLVLDSITAGGGAKIAAPNLTLQTSTNVTSSAVSVDSSLIFANDNVKSIGRKQNGATDFRPRDAFIGTGGITSAGPLVTLMSILNKTTNYTLATNESFKVVNNTSASSQVTNTLPSAAAGLSYCFTVTVTNGIKVVAPGSNTIRIGSTISSAGGSITSTNLGDTVWLVALDSVKWTALSIIGTWTSP